MMNFGTFIALVFLIILWHVCYTIRHFITHIIMDPVISKADKYWGKKIREMDEELQRKCGDMNEKPAEKKVIGFKTIEAINEKEGS